MLSLGTWACRAGQARGGWQMVIRGILVLGVGGLSFWVPDLGLTEWVWRPLFSGLLGFPKALGAQCGSSLHTWTSF